MITVSILSFYSGRWDRGVETWAQNISHHLPHVTIISGLASYLPWKWFPADIIIPTNGRFQTLFCRLVTWLFHKPMFIFGHSGPGADDKWNLLCSPDVFVCFTRAQADWAARFKLPWTKIEVIPHAVDTNIFTPGTKPKNPTVLYVAANHPHKRVDLVINAVKLLPSVKLRIVGAGQPEQVPFAQMPQIYKNASIFCFVPQPWEAFGLVFLEAMATNLPVVTTNDSIRREIIGPAGILVDHPENPHELATAIKKAMDTDWKDIPRRQASKFSWDTIAQKYDQLVSSLNS